MVLSCVSGLVRPSRSSFISSPSVSCLSYNFHFFFIPEDVFFSSFFSSGVYETHSVPVSVCVKVSTSQTLIS